MKLLHCADLHLDSKMMSNLSKEQAKERKKEILRTFVRMVDYAKNHDVTAIMIAGDLFDTEKVSVSTRNFLRDVIASNQMLDFLYLRGNHDQDGFVNQIEERPENLLLFDESWTSYTYGSVAISGIELTKANQLLAYPSLILEKDRFNIVMLHGQIAEYQSGSMGECVSLSDLRNKYIDYLALGHIHSFRMEQLDQRGIYCYSGCLEGRGFDECGDKGFVVIDINEQNLTAKYEFVPFAYRNLYELKVDISNIMTTAEACLCVERAIAKTNYSSNSMVKIVLCGNLSVDSDIDADFIEETFRDYYYFVKVDNQTKLTIAVEDYANDVSLKGEFIRNVMASDLPEELKAQVIHCGIQALSGEEIEG